MDNSLRSTEVFANMPVKKAVHTMAIPAITSQLIILLYNLADTFYIGKTDNPLMVAAVSLLLPVFNVTIAIGCLYGMGGGTVIPKLLALGDKNEAEKAMMFSIRTTFFIALSFSLLLAFFGSPLLKIMGADEEVFPYAQDYLFYVLVIGGIPTVLNNCLASLLRSISFSKEASIGLSGGGILNIILDPIFMFVLLPKGQEVIGVAIATLISNCISFAYLLYVLVKKQKELTISFRNANPTKENKKQLFLIGAPGSLNMLLFDLDYTILNRLMASYSNYALAAIGVVLKAERFPIQVGIGLCQAVVPLASYSYTRKNKERLNSIIRYAVLLGIGFSVISIALFLIFAPEIISVFIKEANTHELGTIFLRPRCIATIFMFLSFYPLHLFQAFGNSKTTFFLGFMRWAMINIPMLFLLNHFFGMMGLAYSQVSADFLVATISFFILRNHLKKLKF